MRIGLDAMGGDLGPAEVVAGALAGCAYLSAEDRIVLVGDQPTIEQALDESDATVPEAIEVLHASEVVGMAESPVEALRAKPDSSIARLAIDQKEGKLDASISAGNTGACVAAAQMRLGRLAGVHRPGIAVVVPTYKGPVVLCDVGANVNCRPTHLHQYAVMSSLYGQATVPEMKTPRVGLLSIGEEESKGNDLVKKTSELLKEDDGLNYIGPVESRDLVSGTCDVMICEGFVGNVMLKLIEGLGGGLMRAVLERCAMSMPDRIAEIKAVGKELHNSYDFNAYGGAPLLGVDGIFIICHGQSSAIGIASAVRAVKEFATHQVNQAITERLSER